MSTDREKVNMEFQHLVQTLPAPVWYVLDVLLRSIDENNVMERILSLNEETIEDVSLYFLSKPPENWYSDDGLEIFGPATSILDRKEAVFLLYDALIQHRREHHADRK